MADNTPEFGSSEAGMKGGEARAKALSKAERSAIARAAGQARWRKAGKLKEVVKATHGSEDHPLRIGEMEIPCYVLEDGKRVLTQNGMLRALGVPKGGPSPIKGGGAEGNRLARFAAGKSLSGFISAELAGVLANPVEFELPNNGGRAYAYEATILADICEAVLAARKAGALMHHQQGVAQRCEILVRGFARVGIVALVDEATGYQDDRDRRSLARFLEAFIEKELRRWVKTFPVEYYKELYRLRGLQYPPARGNRMPQYLGMLTNDIVYKRLAPAVLDELKRKNPANEQGRRAARHHQWLTADIGHPKLLQHLGAVVATMRMAPDWDTFIRNLDKYYPRQPAMPLFDAPPTPSLPEGSA